MANLAPVDASRTAVLSMDLQTAIVSIYTKDQPDLVTRASGVLKKARERRLSVFHIQVGFRPGLPEVSPRNLLFSSIKNSVQHQQIFQGPGGAIHPAVAPEGEDIVITKHRISAFTGTDLDMVLRAKEIETLILFGIATSGVLLATLLDAVDADYRLVVVKDCCADADPQVHDSLVEKVFPRLASVVTAGEAIDMMG